jgi:hypothetical protein
LEPKAATVIPSLRPYWEGWGREPGEGEETGSEGEKDVGGLTGEEEDWTGEEGGETGFEGGVGIGVGGGIEIGVGVGVGVGVEEGVGVGTEPDTVLNV